MRGKLRWVSSTAGFIDLNALKTLTIGDIVLARLTRFSNKLTPVEVTFVHPEAVQIKHPNGSRRILGNYRIAKKVTKFYPEMTL